VGEVLEGGRVSMAVGQKESAVRRRSSIGFALIGAALMVLSLFLPWAFDLAFAVDCVRGSDCVFGVIEHGAGAIVAVVWVILRLRAPRRRSVGGGVLLGTGIASAFMWIGHLGYVVFRPGSALQLGWYAGFLGTALILVAGWVAVRESPESLEP
jgi:hypothetical protein